MGAALSPWRRNERALLSLAQAERWGVDDKTKHPLPAFTDWPWSRIQMNGQRAAGAYNRGNIGEISSAASRKKAPEHSLENRQEQASRRS